MQNCPFAVGDIITYNPSIKGQGSIINTDLRDLQRGHQYKVASIVKDNYIVVEGFENSITGGLWWTEFEPYQPKSMG